MFDVLDESSGRFDQWSSAQIWRTLAEHEADRALCAHAARILACHGAKVGIFRAQVSCVRSRPGVALTLSAEGLVWAARQCGLDVRSPESAKVRLPGLTGAVIPGGGSSLYCPASWAGQLADAVQPRQAGGALDDLLG